MKKAIAAVTLAAAVVATMALAQAQRPVTDAEVQAAIDNRLHELLVRLNSSQR